MDLDWIGAGYREVTSRQSYGSGDIIHGVRVTDLRLFSDEGGDFCEIARVAGSRIEGEPDYVPAQISYSYMEPGTIKAWHLHRRQDDLWFVPPHDRLIVGLLDVREDSPTYQASMRFAFGVGRPRLLFIPRGVAHGVANAGTGGATLIYFTNQWFDANDPDEFRLPYDLLGQEFWQMQPG